ncbi:hypothetical protein [Palleronia caenipelagi]|uniref:UDP-4-amino-4, 6-dideoxy-N-acetyl-beta-L-altrosamine N-acetyltransferase n=1 Tax=Palleronia caenipelagi TaxID=2489174 RepID=A0A547PMU8_9RHOB|nr:hypothetical protein [Palleronia caenipelagi]TRD15435.1 hypothetical protein FEV53_16440 [Palleronia caenipelagi]
MAVLIHFKIKADKSMNTAPQFTFRPVSDDDMLDVLDWRNQEKVRLAMLTQEVISLEDHKIWWAKKMQDSAYNLHILEQDGTPIAVQAFFDIKPEIAAWWAFYFTPHVSDNLLEMMKVWRQVELSGLAYAFDVLSVDVLYCEVLRSNKGVLDWHKRFGFGIADGSISENTSKYDLEVLFLKKEKFTKIRKGMKENPLNAVKIIAS